MAIDFVSIDFETANEKRASVCSVALILFEDGRITKELEWIISPPQHLNYFNPYNVQIHGIEESDVLGKPEFNEVWHEIYPLINHRILVAHNASFDISVLRQLLDCYDLDCPSIEFICTCNVARKTWDKQINYTLKNIGNNLGYIFNHHDAHDDARICGQILLDACKYHCCNSVAELAEKIGLKKGILSSNKYRPCSVSDPYLGLRKGKFERIELTELSPECIEAGGIFSGRCVVFTGTLISMTRHTAAQKVVSHGGYVSNTINKGTNLLVMGVQDFARFVDNKQSSKTKRARELIEKGQQLEIIDENEFLRLLFQEKQENEY
ncbi:MAG: 3'-5' exoribonuclease [Syntrophaceae bacterium]|nr:3'-5' exoribonuclease [Syntrophaceae bacterium]